MLPEHKLRIVSDLKAQGRVVAKVGDGINDAPALAAADIGIAIVGRTDVALETADAAVLHGRVPDVAAMIDLSKRTMGNITENIVISLGLKPVFLATTLIGVTGFWPAILADTGATVLVTMNAATVGSATRLVAEVAQSTCGTSQRLAIKPRVQMFSYRPAIHLTAAIQGYEDSEVKRPASATRRFHACDAASAMES